MIGALSLALASSAGGLAAAAGYIDAHTRRIPNALAVGVALIGIALSASAGFATLSQSLLVSLGLAVAMLVARSVLGKNSLGMGDIKLLCASSLCICPQNLFILLVTAFAGASAFGIIKWITSPQNRREAFAFGPFIAAGLVVAILA